MYKAYAVTGIILTIFLYLTSPIEDPVERELMSIGFILIWILLLLAEYFDQRIGGRRKD